MAAAGQSLTSCSPCKKTFNSAQGLINHLRDSGAHRDYPGNQHDILKAKIQKGIQARLTGQLAPKLHVSDTPSASIPLTVPSTVTAVEAHDRPRNSPYTASEGSSTTKKTRYQHKKAKGLRKNAAAGTPISTSSVILIADRGHDYPTEATPTRRGGASIHPNASTESNTEATIPERTKKAARSERGDSEDESAYFTSEEVEESSSSNQIPQHEPRARLEVFNATVPVPAKSIADSVSPVPSQVQEVARAISASSSDHQILPDAQFQPRVSTSIRFGVSTDWDGTLSSSIPRDIYETTDSGDIHCKLCSKRFSSFQSFEKHYNSSAEHVPQTRLASDYGSSAREGQDGPPPLVRVQEENMPQLERSSCPPPETYLPRQGRASRRPQPPLPSHVCALCNVNYTDLTALQRHKASSTREHPYYCQYCTEEYDNFEQLQTHYQYSRQCQNARPSEGTESSVFNYQDYLTAQNGQREARTTARRAPRSIPSQAVNVAANVDDSASMENVPNCPICITPLSEVADVTATFCGHVFCAPCILEHLRTRNNCPRCRKLISSMMLIPLFF